MEKRDNYSYFYGLISIDLAKILFITILLLLFHAAIILLGIGVDNIPGIYYQQNITTDLNDTQLFGEYVDILDNAIIDTKLNAKSVIFKNEDYCKSFYDYTCSSEYNTNNDLESNHFRDTQIKNDHIINSIILKESTIPPSQINSTINNVSNIGLLYNRCIEYYDVEYSFDFSSEETQLIPMIINEIMDVDNVNNNIYEYFFTLMSIVYKWDLYTLIDVNLQIDPLNRKDVIIQIVSMPISLEFFEKRNLILVYNKYKHQFNNWEEIDIDNYINNAILIQTKLSTIFSNSNKRRKYSALEYLSLMKERNLHRIDIKYFQNILDSIYFDLYVYLELILDINLESIGYTRNSNQALWVYDIDSINNIIHSIGKYTQYQWKSYFITCILLSLEEFSNYRFESTYTYHHGYDVDTILPWINDDKFNSINIGNYQDINDIRMTGGNSKHCFNIVKKYLISNVNDRYLQYIEKTEPNYHHFVGEIEHIGYLIKEQISHLYPNYKNKLSEINIIIGNYFKNENDAVFTPFIKNYTNYELSNSYSYIDCILDIKRCEKNKFTKILSTNNFNYKENNTQQYQNYYSTLFSYIVDYPFTQVNAFYHHQLNSIFISPGILQYPFVNQRNNNNISLNIENISKLGFIIGHELGHSIDPIGVLFDSNGELIINTSIDNKVANFYNRSIINCVEKLYTGRTHFGYINNGETTLNENIADIIGFNTSFSLFNKIISEEYYNNDLFQNNDLYKYFFGNFSSMWCQRDNKDAEYFITNIGIHSVPRYRVNKLIEEYNDIFNDIYFCNNNNNNENSCTLAN